MRFRHKVKSTTNLSRELSVSAIIQDSSKSLLQTDTKDVLIDPLIPKNDYFSRVLDSLPQGRCLTLAYGSGVFQQEGHKSKKDNMTDFIIAVDDSRSWHRQNIDQNPHHYAGLIRNFGPKVIADIQEKWGARIYFNTLIPFEDGMIKYGVISRSDLITDLLDWETLYVAGRLHKPVNILEIEDSQEVSMALRQNLTSSLHTALLLLPDTFSEEQLYLTLAGLSYTGDLRMLVGEDKNKVANIVQPQVPLFRELYKERLKCLEEFVEVEEGRGRQDTSLASRHYHLTMLPSRLQRLLVKDWNRDGISRDVEEVIRAAASDPDTEDMVKRSVSHIVAMSSTSQALKGILSAGAVKTVRYSLAKLRKMFKSMKT